MELPKPSDTARCRRLQDLNHVGMLTSRKDEEGMKKTKKKTLQIASQYEWREMQQDKPTASLSIFYVHFPSTFDIFLMTEQYHTTFNMKSLKSKARLNRKKMNRI